MTLLIIYVLVAVGFSFLCSIAEAVLLSITPTYIVSLEKEGSPSGKRLRELKDNLNSPLAVILTINTIAHTMGAAGAGAQATAVFGSVYLGIFSAILTIIILVFSEIVPKALGAHYWRALAPITGITLKFLVRVLHPFVVISNALTRGLTEGPTLKGFSRKEFAAMAELGEEEGTLNERESHVLRNLFQLRQTTVESAMTPRSVVYSLDESNTIAEVMDMPLKKGFSRIPVYSEPGQITGFVLRDDLLVAHSEEEHERDLASFRRELDAIFEKASLLTAFEEFTRGSHQIMLVVDEYGEMQGVLTLEDILESLLGMEIMDESDTVPDMQQLARRLGALRRRKMGLEDEPEEIPSSAQKAPPPKP